MELLTPNVALNREANQSSSYHHTTRKDDVGFDEPDGAHYAIDGNFSTDLTSGARCAITKPRSGSWWQVDLKYEFEIKKVAVTTTKYCKLIYFGISRIILGVTDHKGS